MKLHGRDISILGICGGPSSMEILNALFFDRERRLIFNIYDASKNVHCENLYAKIIGIIPNDISNTMLLIVAYHESESSPEAITAIQYEDHPDGRRGKFSKLTRATLETVANPFNH